LLSFIVRELLPGVSADASFNVAGSGTSTLRRTSSKHDVSNVGIVEKQQNSGTGGFWPTRPIRAAPDPRLAADLKLPD